MSDFIKVNFKDGSKRVLRRPTLQLIESEPRIAGCPGPCYAATVISKLNSIAAILSTDEECRDDEYFNQVGYTEITREEYDRLCKELGIE